MPISRRKFIKNTALGGLAFAASSPGIYFPKPANSYSLNFVLSDNGPVQQLFQQFLAFDVATGTAETLPPDVDSAVAYVVENLQSEFTERDFNNASTPFSMRRSNVNNPLWGRERQESVGPNSGFGTVQTTNNYVEPIHFTGPTTAGIGKGLEVLKVDENLSPIELDNALMPWQILFDDWGDWQSDEAAGEQQTASLAEYGTRWGQVTRRYSIEEPGPGGRATIRMTVDGGQNVRSRFFIDVFFA